MYLTSELFVSIRVSLIAIGPWTEEFWLFLLACESLINKLFQMHPVWSFFAPGLYNSKAFTWMIILQIVSEQKLMTYIMIPTSLSCFTASWSIHMQLSTPNILNHRIHCDAKRRSSADLTLTATEVYFNSRNLADHMRTAQLDHRQVPLEQLFKLGERLKN